MYLLPDLRTLFLWLTFPAVLQSGAGQLVPPLGDRPPEKTGSAPELSLTSSLQVVWRFDDHGNAPGLSDVAAVHGMLFFGDDNGVVRTLAAKQGMKIWSHNHGERIFYAPTSDGERLFFTSGRGLTALQAASGLLLWHHPIEHGAGRCVASRNAQRVYCGGSDGWVYAFDAATGDQQWKYSIMDDAPKDPPGFDGERARIGDATARPTGIATDGHLVYQCVFDQCRVVAIQCVTGQKQWSFQTGGWILGDPAVDDQRLYVGSQDKHIYCLNKTTGEVLWKSATGSRIESGPAVNDSRVFIASCDGSLYCYAKETGVLIWKFAADRDGNRASAIYSAPIVTHDSLIFAAAEGHVYALVAETGVLRWKLQPSKTSHLYTTPATDGTRIFVKSRPQAQGVGENVIIAIGPSPDSN